MLVVRSVGAIARRAFVSAAVVLVACGGGGSTDSFAVERSDAQKQCDSLMAVWCESSLECVQSGLAAEDRLTEAELSDERELCIDVAKRTCDATVAVNDGYDACLASVETLETPDCDAIQAAEGSEEPDVAMPASCSEVFVSG